MSLGNTGLVRRMSGLMSMEIIVTIPWMRQSLHVIDIGIVDVSGTEDVKVKASFCTKLQQQNRITQTRLTGLMYGLMIWCAHG